MTNDADLLDDDARWQAVLRRDRALDGAFVTGVLSTGIYCRPSCAARHPRRKNVRFFASPGDAEAAGLHACKRCRPDAIARDEAAVRAVIDALRGGEQAPLRELAQLTGYSPAHLQRLFKRATGLSPAGYARALREERGRAELARGSDVTGAIYAAGYESPSRFYADMKGKLGMTASDWRNGGEGRTIHWARAETSLGPMLVAATERGVCYLSFDASEERLRAQFPKADLIDGGEDFRMLFEGVTAAVERPGTGHDIPLDVQGTAFQQRVWQALRDIPAGETRSYAELAAALGNPKASRAVGGANGANRVAVLIPCHRVIAADGGLGGYAYGPEIKTELLRRERGD